MAGCRIFSDDLSLKIVHRVDEVCEYWCSIAFDSGIVSPLRDDTDLSHILHDLPSISVDGILGMMRLNAGWYLLAVTESAIVGYIEDQAVYAVKRIQPIPMTKLHADQIIRQTPFFSSAIFKTFKSPERDSSAQDSTETIKTVSSPVQGSAVSVNDASSIHSVSSSTASRSPDGSARMSPDRLKNRSSPSLTFQKISAQVKDVGLNIVSHFENIRQDISRSTDRTPEPGTSSFGSASMFDLNPLRSARGGSPARDAADNASFQSNFRNIGDLRILTELSALLTAGNFYFSRTFDLTNSYQRKESDGYGDNSIDNRFWWNREMTSMFLGQELFGVPLKLMQGHFHSETCSLEGTQFDFIIISRRSVHRCGLRYQRRGVDESGHVANFVETEMVIHFRGTDKVAHVVSFVQIRGSVPIYWNQVATQRKPIPVLDRSTQDNQNAFSLHFQELKSLYGDNQVVVSLVESTGREAIVGKAFRKYANLSYSSNLRYHEFDVHLECRGMHYENIEKLLLKIDPEVHKVGYFWKGPKGVLSRQEGIIRTNCMDCLDRTNVVQSAIGRFVLNLQLLRVGVHSYPEKGLGYYGEFEISYNHAWANNGDSISIAYTNTSALKGDVTRTGKRNVRGLLTDGASALMRMYQNNFRDAFRQKVIDYALGNLPFDSLMIEVQEQTLTSPEESEGIVSESETEQEDIVTTVKDYVLAVEEKLLDGLIIQIIQPNAFAAKEIVFDERVLLITNDAVYICTYDIDLEKVTQYRRIVFENILQIQTGSVQFDKIASEESDWYGIGLSYNSMEDESRVSGTKFSAKELFAMLHQDSKGKIDSNTVQFILDPQPTLNGKVMAEKISSRLANLCAEVPMDKQKKRLKPFILEGPLRGTKEIPDNSLKRFSQMIKARIDAIPKKLSISESTQE